MYLMHRLEWPPTPIGRDSGREQGLSDVTVRFGKRLREVREEADISQEKLADLAGLHRTYVSSVERGKNNISLLNIERLAQALGVTMGELMPDTKRPDRKKN